MPNMEAKIRRHNNKILRKNDQSAPQKSCNCRNQNLCPLNGNCITGPVVYRATVTSNNQAETYTRSAGNGFKERHRNHTTDFKYSHKRANTDLAGHIWSLKDKGQNFDIKWDILKQTSTYNPNSKSCMVCLEEKIHIMFSPADATLNRRDEFFTHCRHKAKKLLENT